MKSDDLTAWMIIKHIFGFHTWSAYRYWYAEEPDSSNDYGQDCQGVYVNCEICAVEKVISYPY